MELRVIRTEEEFDRIKPQWDELLATLDPVPLPLTHDWLRAWWHAFSVGMHLEIRCAYLGCRLVGVAPLVRSRERYRGFTFDVLRLAANGHTPYSGVIVEPTVIGKERREAFIALTEVGRDEIVQFFKINSHSDLKHFLLDPPAFAVNRVGVKPGILTPVISIKQDWESFYRARPRKLKKSINHKLNRFNRNPGFSVSEERITETAQPIVDELVEVSAKSWKSSIGNDLKSHHRSRQFLLNLIDSFGRSGALSTWVVRDEGKLVAYELHLLYDDIVYPIRADYDEAYKAFSPGSVLEYSALKYLFEKGSVRQYYTCADDYWYLSNWTSDYEEFCTVELFGNSLRLKLLYIFEYRLIPVVKRILGKHARTARPV